MTTDTNELRRKLGSDDLIDHIDIHANVKPALTELLGRIEVAEKDIALKERVIDSLGSELNAVANERDALLARIEAMEQQFPICRVKDIKRTRYMTKVVGLDPDAWLYLAPGAQPAPSVPVDVITDYLVSISAHVAHQDDLKAQAELGDLLRMLAAAPEAKP